MKVISVEKDGLLEDFSVWNVKPQYVDLFMKKCEVKGQRVALKPFVFNDTMHLNDSSQLLSAQAAYWIRVCREARSYIEQADALASIRSLYYAAAALGVSSVTCSIAVWWKNSYDLHGLPALNISQIQNSPLERLAKLTKH